MDQQADETIRRMRVMRARTGHWRAGGFGADVVIALSEPAQTTTHTQTPHLKQRSAALWNTMLVCASMMIGLW